MKNLRKYGNAPFNIAVIHGGPGVPGEVAPVARESKSYVRWLLFMEIMILILPKELKTLFLLF